MTDNAVPYDFDVAVTFAGEDRALVSQVVELVKAAGYSVFYDEDEQAAIWGEELTEYFPDIYERRARYAVMFISADYAAKPWTRLERRSVLLRAMNQSSPYLLPVRIDQTVLPGVRESVSYLDAKKLGSTGIAQAIGQKLGDPVSATVRMFNGLVPRTELEVATLLGERPSGWEYLMFSYALVDEFNKRNDLYLDYQVGFAASTDFVPDAEVLAVVDREQARVLGNTRNFMTVLSPDSQLRAFGAPGEAGDVETILHLAGRLAQVYEFFMTWSIGMRGMSTKSDEAHRLFDALAHFSDQPVQRMHDFPTEFRGHVDGLSTAVANGENFELELVLPLEVSEAANKKFDVALRAFGTRLKGRG